MKTLGRILSRICVAMLLLVVSGFALLYLLPALGFCSRIDSSGITCSGAVSSGLAEFALVILITSVFTGIPLLIALIGAVILAIRLFRKLRRT